MRPPGIRRAAGGGEGKPGGSWRRGSLTTGAHSVVLLDGSPVGSLELSASVRGLSSLRFTGGTDDAGRRLRLDEEPTAHLTSGPGGAGAARHLGDACRWLSAYFRGVAEPGSLAVDLSGLRPFQLRVYDELRRVPFGEIVTYGGLAHLLGLGPRSARAVGRAVASNPLPIVIPCHRVVGADGRLGGFSGGLGRKASLLRLEGIDVEGERQSSRVAPGALRLDL